jgi:hypothetical protein
MMSEEYGNPLPLALEIADLGLKEQLLCRGYKSTAI